MKKLFIKSTLIAIIFISIGAYAGTGWKVTITNNTKETLTIREMNYLNSDWNAPIATREQDVVIAPGQTTKQLYIESSIDPNGIGEHEANTDFFAIDGKLGSSHYAFIQTGKNNTPIEPGDTGFYDNGLCYGKYGAVDRVYTLRGHVVSKAPVPLSDAFYAGIFHPDVLPAGCDGPNGTTPYGALRHNDFYTISNVKWKNSGETSSGEHYYGQVIVSFDINANPKTLNDVAELP